MLEKLKNRFVMSALYVFTIVLVALLIVMNIFLYTGTITNIEEIIEEIANKNCDEFRSVDDCLFSFQKESIFNEIYVKKIYNKHTRILSYEINPKYYFSNESIEYLSKESAGQTDGFINNFRFKVFDYEEKKITVYMDIGKYMQILNSFETYSVISFFICEFFVFILLLIFFNKVLTPVAENIKQQRDFIDSASHELKTPMAIIGANNEIMEIKVGENKWTQSTKRQLNRMNSLINQMLKLSEYGEYVSKVNVELKDIDISQIATKILEDMESIIISKNITVVNPKQSFFIKMDEKMAKEMMDIIIDNSIKYCLEGGRIQIDTTLKYYAISNSSLEMSEEDTRNLFKKFYRTDKARSRQTGGNGMGLAIAKSISDLNKVILKASYENKMFCMKILKTR